MLSYVPTYSRILNVVVHSLDVPSGRHAPPHRRSPGGSQDSFMVEITADRFGRIPDLYRGLYGLDLM